MLVKQRAKKIHVRGLTAIASVFGSIAAYYYSTSTVFLAAIGFSIVLLAISFWRYQWLLGPTQLWMTFNDWITITLFYMLLALLFYAVVTPISLVRRLRKIDRMQRNYEPGLPSYKIVSKPIHKDEIRRPF